ncbi:MAG: 50S ribosomal protein L24, partial [Candidatus Omnitrophota bacterium]
HMRQRGENAPGGIKEIPAPVDVSNVALYCSKCGKGVKFGVKLLKDKTKIRVCKKCQQTI